jgi:hypothetical protein
MDIQWLIKMPQPMTESGKPSSAPLVLRAGDLLTAAVLDVENGNDALLAFGQFKAYARLPLPVVTGQTVRIRVEESGQGLRMVLLPQDAKAAGEASAEKRVIRLFEPVSDKPLPAAHSRSLVPGESLYGRITGFEKDGLKLVDFGIFKAFAKIDIPVRQGQVIPLTVVKADHGIAFSLASRSRSSAFAHPPPSVTVPPVAQDNAIVPKPGSTSPGPFAPTPTGSPSGGDSSGQLPPPTAADMAVLREQIQLMRDGAVQLEKDATAPIKGALINLQQLLDPASTTGSMTNLAARIRGFIENSGIYFEKRMEQVIQNFQDRGVPMTPTELAGQPAVCDLMVNDMKPNLLILKQFLDAQTLNSPGADRHTLETLKNVVQRAVSHIEQQQAMATEKPVDPDLLQAFSHLLLLTDTRHNARLKVYYAKKGRGEAHKNPRVSLLLEMDRLGRVRTDLWMIGKDLNVTFYVREASIKTAIETTHHRFGERLKEIFNTVAVSVVVSEKKIAEFEGEDLIAHNRRQVDLSI